DYIRLHALWTLDGLNEVDDETLKAALSDPSPHLRAAAIRIAEPAFSSSENTYQAAVMNLVDDSSRIVQRQLAASAGEFSPERRNQALIDIVNRHGDDPMVTSLVMSGLPGREFAFLERLLEQSQQQQGTAGAARALAKNILQSDADEQINTLLTWITD